MSVDITLEQTNTIEEGATPDEPIYQVKNEIVATTNISLALFVLKTEDDSFSHVATPRDLELYADNKPDAVTNGDAYYRDPLAILQYTAITPASEFASLVRVRLQYLANSWPTAQDDFTGLTTYVFHTAG